MKEKYSIDTHINVQAVLEEDWLAEADKIVRRWTVYPGRVPKADIIGTLIALRDALRALLAEQPEAGGELISCPACNMVVGRTDAPAPSPARDEVREALLHCESIFLRYEVNRPDAEQITDGALALIRGALSAISSDSTRREASGCVCSDKARGYCPVHDTFLPTLPPPPAPEAAAVREAAERLWHSLTPPRSTADDGMLLVRAEDVEAVLRAHASPPAAPARDEVREAAERLRAARMSQRLTCTTSYIRVEAERVLINAVDRLLSALSAGGPNG